jgi:hypothetical protein
MPPQQKVWKVNIKDKPYIVTVSRRKKAKYDVYTIDKDNKLDYLLSFGAIKDNGVPYDQYQDKFGYYSKYDHLNKARRDRYYARHGHSDDVTSAKFWSNWALW